MDTMRERFEHVTSELLDSEPRLAVVTADIGASAFEPARRKHPDRVINLGIREQLMIGVTSGLALTGMRPVAHTFAPFLIERPFEQIKLDITHQGVGAVLVSAGGSYDYPFYGRTHLAPGDVALLDTLPGWTVHVPGHPDEAEMLLRHAIAGSGSVYVRLALLANAAPFPIRPDGFTVLRRGSSGTVIAVGPLADAVLAATSGLDVTVLYAATVRPFDVATLRDAVGAGARIRAGAGARIRAGAGAGLGRADVVLVEPYLAGTSVPFVAEALVDLPHRVLGLGVGRDELRRYGTPAEHQAAHGLDAASLRLKISAFLGGSLDGHARGGSMATADAGAGAAADGFGPA
jgi:transketolase